VELVRAPDGAAWWPTAEQITAAHEEQPARLAERPDDPTAPHTARARQAMDQGYADVISTLPYEADSTPVFELPGD
jgi:hypothetical protein